LTGESAIKIPLASTVVENSGTVTPVPSSCKRVVPAENPVPYRISVPDVCSSPANPLPQKDGDGASTSQSEGAGGSPTWGMMLVSTEGAQAGAWNGGVFLLRAPSWATTVTGVL
jgi:hypothetical protein